MGTLVCLDSYRKSREQGATDVKERLIEHLQQAAQCAASLDSNSNKILWMIEDCAHALAASDDAGREQENEDFLFNLS